MNYEKICQVILDVDKSIRYVGVYDYGELYDKTRKGLKSYLTKEETETSLSQAVYRWSTRKKTTEKIGKPVYAMAKYEKIYRITIPIGGAGLILISTELDANINEITDKILEIIPKFGV
ncbi:hypothetical protein NsoK4_08400 [Nitrosopumilus sp. K4]|uniref:hypothetical protein n=1 Tax=Nitrosopumilus sp. K4 TaxID=2795383 RepID=UPI001BA5C336|nr:hypothetical protein [Nitrosopumilus sp. K4]QUC64433.1 hypothetical protein NsoK4_08400 [Nitrosopumilus sp. K4]